MLHNQTITVFNRYADTWFPKVLHGVHALASKSSLIKEYGPDNTDNLSVHILLKDGKIGGVEYVPRKKFVGEGVTLAEGDLILVGEYSEAPVNDRDYPTGFYHYLNMQEDFLYKISSVSFFHLIPHFEVTAK